MKLDLLAQTIYLIATNEQHRAKEVIEGAIVEATLTNTPIPNSFWFGIIKLDPALLKDLLPSSWTPESDIWIYALTKSQELTTLLLDRFPNTFEFQELPDDLLPRLDERFFPITSLGAPRSLGHAKLRWLAQHQPNSYIKIAEQYQSTIYSDRQLMELTPATLLRSWMAESNITGMSGSGQTELANLLLDKVLPLLPQPYNEQPEIKHLLTTNLTPQRDYNFCYLLCQVYARRQPADYMTWFKDQLMGSRQQKNGTLQVWMPQNPELLQTHAEIICANADLRKLITPEMELRIFATPLRHKFETPKNQWNTVQALQPKTQQAEISNIITESLTQSTSSPLLSKLISKLKDYDPPVLKLGSISLFLFKKVLNRCTPAGRANLIKSALDSDHTDIITYLIQNLDVASFIPAWNPLSSLWCSEIARIHPANADPLLERLQRLGKPSQQHISPFATPYAEMLRHVIACHPNPSLPTLVQALSNGYYKFKYKHLSNADRTILERVAKLVKNNDFLRRLN